MGTIKTISSSIIGGILFAWIFNDAKGLFVGMALGFLLGKNSIQGCLLDQMEKRLEEYETRLQSLQKILAPANPPVQEKSSVQPAVEPAKRHEASFSADTTRKKIEKKQGQIKSGSLQPRPARSMTSSPFIVSSAPSTP
ncbi:MAG: hypothetical protein D3924_14200, partial [Candidatus Electrothrix sp. AR4]|nr:hypothetical protein [Candidatus Electrothrix sp. AR4]